MVRHPKKVDFTHLYTNLETHVCGLRDYLKSLYIEYTELAQIKNNDRTNQNYIDIGATQVLIAEAEVEIESKQRLLDEYKARLEVDIRDNELEKKEVKEKFVNTYKEAYRYKSDFSLPKQIRDHLKEMLSFDFKKLDDAQMITYYLMLKSEIKMIKNYKARK